MTRSFDEPRVHWLLRLLGNLFVFAALAGGIAVLLYVVREGARAGGLL